jgi:hypothetical protein
MLKLHEYMWYGEGPSLAENRRAIGFEVLGLPESQQAWIANDGHRWQVLRAKDGVQGHWSGRFGNADEALASIQ